MDGVRPRYQFPLELDGPFSINLRSEDPGKTRVSTVWVRSTYRSREKEREREMEEQSGWG